MKIPSVIALRQYVKPSEFPAFTRFNLFLRDRFSCQYCGSQQHLTFDHVDPAPAGRQDHVGKHPHRLRAVQHEEGRPHARSRRGMHSLVKPIRPTSWQLQQHGKQLPAELPARDLARLALLGHRAGGIGGGRGTPKGAFAKIATCHFLINIRQLAASAVTECNFPFATEILRMLAIGVAHGIQRPGEPMMRCVRTTLTTL